jgi:hypothetical protein
LESVLTKANEANQEPLELGSDPLVPFASACAGQSVCPFGIPIFDFDARMNGLVDGLFKQSERKNRRRNSPGINSSEAQGRDLQREFVHHLAPSVIDPRRWSFPWWKDQGYEFSWYLVGLAFSVLHPSEP